VDNFNGWASTSAATYQQRYLINDTWWTPGKGPIFFYTGNEGDITLFAANTGLVWELAPKFNALVVFAEHRYYGLSMPFGNESYDNDNVGFLSSEQALADYAALLDSLKTNLSAPNVPVISFGGSYGGMLSAWFRQKYPASVAGAIAASAPVRQFTGGANSSVYNSIVTRTFNSANAIAGQAIYNSWGVMATLANTQAGRNSLSSWFQLCENQINSPSDVTNTVYNWISNAISYMAMADYPYPASFLGPMPAWPVAAAAAFLTDANAPPKELISALQQGVINVSALSVFPNQR
jgi:pimeloyl-ACP methyl ester carboxylesterase